MNDFVKKGYDLAAKNYSAARDQFKSNKYLEQLTNRLPSGAHILDLGCGSGVPVDRFLADRGFQITGLDISPRQIELAKENVPQGDYRIVDMSTLLPGQFNVDAVVSFYAIFHIDRRQHLRLLQTINSFLPPKGLLLVTLGAEEWEGYEEDFYGAKMWWSHFGADHNNKLIQDAGFNPIISEVDTSGGERHLVVLAEKN